MKIYRGFSDRALADRPRAVAVGIFDGVHLGHRRILARARAEARRANARALVLTFDPHPAKVLGRGEDPPIIHSLPHRLRLLAREGMDEALVVRFDRRLSRLTPDAFLDKLARIGLRTLVVGHDFRFGRAGAGDVAFLERAARERGFRLCRVPALSREGEPVSSTRIRRLVERGRLAEAARLLGRPVSVSGTVVRGKGRGHRLGFPTANLNPHHETLPPAGVYAAHGLLDGRPLRGVLHIGARPTFGERERSLEAHFLDFDEDIYGREVELFFVSRLRPVRRFRGPKDLAAAVRADIGRARRLLGPGADPNSPLQRGDGQV